MHYIYIFILHHYFLHHLSSLEPTTSRRPRIMRLTGLLMQTEAYITSMLSTLHRRKCFAQGAFVTGRGTMSSSRAPAKSVDPTAVSPGHHLCWMTPHLAACTPKRITPHATSSSGCSRLPTTSTPITPTLTMQADSVIRVYLINITSNLHQPILQILCSSSRRL